MAIKQLLWKRSIGYNSRILNNTEQRKNISAAADICQLYKLDGINIDFENIYMRDKNGLLNS